MALYKRENQTSYTLGITLTIELLKSKPELIEHIYFHTDFDGKSKEIITNMAKKNNIDILVGNKIFNILSQKDNCYAIAEFKKYQEQIDYNENHLVLVNPSDAGNIGTIMRSSLGFGITNLIIIKPAVDYFNPKAVRSSMGAIFHLNIKEYDSFEDYLNEYKNHYCYPFMLKATKALNDLNEPLKKPFSLVFGNEATGLSDQFLEIGTPLIIKHSNKIDSLNLPIAVSIGLYEATKHK